MASTPTLTRDRAARLPFLDGLRGLSILPVILGHAFFYRWPVVPLPLNGTMGVRVFFVISGYIITYLLMEEKRQHEVVRLRAFFGRRSAKLLPVLWAYVAVRCLLEPPATAMDWLRAATAATLTTAYISPTWMFGHVWSLSVEETFYLLWAPLMARLQVRRAGRLALLLIPVALAVNGLPVLARSRHLAGLLPALPHIPVVGDLDVIAIGCLAAIHRDRLIRLLPSWKSLPVIFGALAIVVLQLDSVDFAAFGLNRISSVVTTCGNAVGGGCVAALILALAKQHEAGGRSLLSGRPLRALGRASYSIYVVQQAFCVPLELGPQRWFQRPPWGLLLALTVGGLAFRFLEDPVRRWLTARFALAVGQAAAPPPASERCAESA